MQYDIIDIPEEEVEKLNTVQLKMLRTAQQKKDELYHKVELDMKMFRSIVMTAGTDRSTLIDAKREELEAEAAYKCVILADNLIYNMSLNEPPEGGAGGDGDETAGYIVDYSLSYNERYIIVRDYYLSIADPDERMALYAADDVARQYLSTYYGTLYNTLATYSR